MSEVMQDLTAELTTDCTCTNEDGTETDTCFDCYEMDKGGFLYLIDAWRDVSSNATDTVLINGKGLSWESREGFCITEFDDVLDKLTLNGEYTLRLRLSGDKLTCKRASHDEIGASFEFSFVPDQT